MTACATCGEQYAEAHMYMSEAGSICMACADAADIAERQALARSSPDDSQTLIELAVDYFRRRKWQRIVSEEDDFS